MSKSKSKTHSVLERAGKNFVLQGPLTISRKEMIVTLPASVREQIIARYAEDGKPVAGIDFRVRLFGGHHQTFKREVLSPRAAMRTYADKVGTPTRKKVDGCRASSDRLIPISKLTDYLQTLDRMEQVAISLMRGFVPHYDEYLEAGRHNVDHNFPFKVEWKGHKVPVSEVLADQTPTREEFEAAFQIVIPQPRRLTLTDWSDVDLPAEMADKWAADELSAVEEQLDNAKERLILKAKKLVERVDKQLSKDADQLAPFKSLITDAAELGEALRGLVDGYDPADLQLRNAAIAIAEKIGAANIDHAGEPTTERWKNSVAARQEAVRAARAAGKVLAASQKILDRKRKASETPADVSPKADGLMVDSGMLADIL